MSNRTFKVPNKSTSNTDHDDISQLHQDLTYQSNSYKEDEDMTKVRRCGAGWVYCDGTCSKCPGSHIETSSTTIPDKHPMYSTTTHSDPDCEGDWDSEDHETDDCFCED